MEIKNTNMITIVQNKKNYRILTTFFDKSIDIVILHEGLAFTAKVSEEHISHWASSLGFSDRKYFICLKQYLTTAYYEVSFHISKSEFNMYKTNGTKYLSVRLIQDNYKCIIEKLIDSLKRQYCDVKQNHESLEIKLNDTRTDASNKGRALTNFAYQCSETKENTKSTCLTLLNLKCRRIQFLVDIIKGDIFEINTTKLLRAAMQGASADNVSTSDDSQKSDKETPDEDMSSNNEDFEFDLLDENEIDMLTVPFRKLQEAASTSITVTEPSNEVVELNDNNIMDTSLENSQDLICSTQDLLQRID